MFFSKRKALVFLSVGLMLLGAQLSSLKPAQAQNGRTIYEALTANINQGSPSLSIVYTQKISFSIEKAKLPPTWTKTKWVTSLYPSNPPLICTEERGQYLDFLNCQATNDYGLFVVTAENADDSTQVSNSIAVSVSSPREADFISCINPPENHLPSTCIDEFRGGAWIRNSQFSCQTGYSKSGNQCVLGKSVPTLYQPITNQSTSSNSTSTSKNVEIVDKYSASDYILLQVRNIWLSSGELYYGTCHVSSNRADAQSVTVPQPEKVDVNNSINIPVRNLKPDTEYTCTVGISTSNGQSTSTTINTNNTVKIRTLPNQSVNNPTNTTENCQSPYVLYNGQCSDPIPTCKIFPENSVGCIDKIENGRYIPYFNIICKAGYSRSGNSCVKNQNGSVPPQAQTTAPLAGYEDEVRVNYQASENPFGDTNIGGLEGKAAAELFFRGVIGGFPDGEFKGDRLVNRAEAAKFLLLARGLTNIEDVSVSKFRDVIVGEWYTRFTEEAAALGVIKGYSDGTFRPINNVQPDEFLAMMARNFNLPTGLPHSYLDLEKYPGAWFWDYAGIAQKYELFPSRGQYLDPERPLTRNEVAVAIYQYLKNRDKGENQIISATTNNQETLLVSCKELRNHSGEESSAYGFYREVLRKLLNINIYDLGSICTYDEMKQFISYAYFSGQTTLQGVISLEIGKNGEYKKIDTYEAKAQCNAGDPAAPKMKSGTADLEVYCDLGDPNLNFKIGELHVPSFEYNSK